MSSFSKKLKILLKERNMTQKELAKLANTTPATISRYIKGERAPGSELLNNIANTLNVTTDYLLGNTGKVTGDENSMPIQIIGKGGTRIEFEIPADKVNLAKKLMAILVEDDIKDL